MSKSIGIDGDIYQEHKILGFPSTKEPWLKPKTLEDWPWGAQLGKPHGMVGGAAGAAIHDGSSTTFKYDEPSPSATILAEAIGLLEGERAKQHGDKLALHKTMAALFSAYLDVPIKPSQAAMIEALMKVARTKHGQLNADDYRDGSAYLGISWECADAGC